MAEKLKRYQIRYEDRTGAEPESKLIETDSIHDFHNELAFLVEQEDEVIMHIRIGNRRAIVRWYETTELPDSPI